MNQYYTVKELIAKLQNVGIKVHRANLFLKIKKGILKPQAFTTVGKRIYPKYSNDYVSKLIACATIETKLDWNKVKDVTNSLTEIPQKI